MAGSPLKRQRELGIRDKDGSVTAFPLMPRVADLPPGWRRWSPAEKIEHLRGMSLDDAYEIHWWPIGELDPFRLSVRMQVIRIVFAIGIKGLLDVKLGREAARERNPVVLEELDRKLRAEANNERPGSRKGFTDAMAAHGYLKDKSHGVRGYSGIDVKTQRGP